MEKENEFLIATSDGFYYEGVPSTGSYTSSKKADDYIPSKVTEDVFRKVETGIIIVQVLIVILCLVCFFKGVLNFRKNKEQNRKEEMYDIRKNEKSSEK